MTGEQIYNWALRKTHTDSEDYTTDEANIDIEIRHQEVVDKIVSVTKEDFFWDTGAAPTVVGQSEYLAEKLGLEPDDLDIKKINKVFVRYTEEQIDPTPVTYVSPDSLEKHPDYYKRSQSTSDPFFYIQDKSIFIYPAPTVAIGSNDENYTGNQGLELFVIHKPAAISVTSTEEEIEIETQYHKIIALGLMIDIYLSQGKVNEAQYAEGKYEKALKIMTSELKERYNAPIKRTFKNNLNQYR